MNIPDLNTIISQQPYPLLFATISSSHLYGFPSPDSDYDLRGVHILPVREVVGLSSWAWKKPTMLRYINTENVSTEVTEIWVPV